MRLNTSFSNPIFMIDNEEGVIRHLASLAWTDRFISASEKKQNEQIRKQKEEKRFNSFTETLNEINKNRCVTGGEDPRKKKKMIADKFSETVKVVI